MKKLQIKIISGKLRDLEKDVEYIAGDVVEINVPALNFENNSTTNRFVITKSGDFCSDYLDLNFIPDFDEIYDFEYAAKVYPIEYSRWGFKAKFIAPCDNPEDIGIMPDYSATIPAFINEYRSKVKSREDIMWTLCRNQFMTDRELRLFAVWSARQVQHLMTDERSINALDIAEKYANGLATDIELSAAWAAACAARDAACAARDAAWAARDATCATWAAARGAAWAAAWAAWAARDAVRDAQIDYLLDLFKNKGEQS